MEKQNTQVVESLNQLLINYQVHYQNLRLFHWNVKGPFFFVLHAKFEELYLDAALKVDEIA
jgi:starvation-inducible DNA-binding protein